MKKLLLSAIVSFLLLFLVIGCASKTIATTTPPPTSTPPTKSPMTTSPSPKAPNPEDVAWSGVLTAAKKEGRLTYYNWGFTGDKGLALAAAFRSAYGIEVELISGRGAEFTERLKTEARMGQRTADAIESAPSPFAKHDRSWSYCQYC